MSQQLEIIALAGVILVVIASMAALLNAWLSVGGMEPDEPFLRVLEPEKSRTVESASRADIVNEALRVAIAAAGVTVGGAVIASVARVASGKLTGGDQEKDGEQIIEEIRKTLREELAVHKSRLSQLSDNSDAKNGA